MRTHSSFLPAIAALLLGACASNPIASKKDDLLTETLRSYAATIRWGDVTQAQAFMDPQVLAAHPPSSLELSRFEQVRITGYTEQSPVPTGTNEVRQVVEIGLVNVNTQSARSVLDRQTWRYDETAKRWYLMSGLPDITQSH